MSFSSRFTRIVHAKAHTPRPGGEDDWGKGAVVVDFFYHFSLKSEEIQDAVDSLVAESIVKYSSVSQSGTLSDRIHSVSQDGWVHRTVVMGLSDYPSWIGFADSGDHKEAFLYAYNY